MQKIEIIELHHIEQDLEKLTELLIMVVDEGASVGFYLHSHKNKR